jgi:hypothetical protein
MWCGGKYISGCSWHTGRKYQIFASYHSGFKAENTDLSVFLGILERVAMEARVMAGITGARNAADLN